MDQDLVLAVRGQVGLGDGGRVFGVRRIRPVVAGEASSRVGRFIPHVDGPAHSAGPGEREGVASRELDMRGHLRSVYEIGCRYRDAIASSRILDGGLSHFFAALVEQCYIQRFQVVNIVVNRILHILKVDVVIEVLVDLCGHIHGRCRIACGFRRRYRDVGYVVWRGGLKRERAVGVHADVLFAAAFHGVAERTVALDHLGA